MQQYPPEILFDLHSDLFLDINILKRVILQFNKKQNNSYSNSFIKSFNKVLGETLKILENPTSS